MSDEEQVTDEDFEEIKEINHSKASSALRVLALACKKANNDLDYKEIGIITSDFVKVSDQLKLTCSKIITNNFSKFPIIIMSMDEISIGSLLISNGELLDNKWKYYDSYLELLTEKKIISNSKKFIKNYKKSNEFSYLLVIFNNNSNIIYIPNPED